MSRRPSITISTQSPKSINRGVSFSKLLKDKSPSLSINVSTPKSGSPSMLKSNSKLSALRNNNNNNIVIKNLSDNINDDYQSNRKRNITNNNKNKNDNVSYKYEGIIESGRLKGKKVEWEGVFPNKTPIDMVYPSLKLFDETVNNSLKSSLDNQMISSPPILIRERSGRLSPLSSFQKRKSNYNKTKIDTSTDTSLPMWKVKITDSIVNSNIDNTINSSPNNNIDFNQSSTFNQTILYNTIPSSLNIEEIGELYSRKQMRERCELQLNEEAKLNKEKQSDLVNMGTLSAATKKKVNLANLTNRVKELKPEDEIYLNLTRKVTESLEQKQSSQSRRQRIIPRVTYEEEIYLLEKEKLGHVLNSSDAYTLDGLMYYRVKKKLNDELNDKPTVKSTTRQSFSLLSTRNRRQSTVDKLNINSIRNTEMSYKMIDSNSRGHLLDGQLDDKNNSKVDSTINRKLSNLSTEYDGYDNDTTRASTYQSLDKEILDIDLSRVRRALTLNQHEYNFKEIYNNKYIQTLTDNPSTKQSNNLPFHKSLSTNPPTNLTNNPLINNNLRYAQDSLILTQLKHKLLPENFIKHNYVDKQSNELVLDISHFGIGDEQGKAFGESLQYVTNLYNLSIHNNRLSSNTMAVIIEYLPFFNLQILDISNNNMTQQGSLSLSDYVIKKNQLKYLNISNCNINDLDMIVIANSLITSTSKLNCKLINLNISENSIGADGCTELSKYISLSYCLLETLNLSWNNIGADGAIALANSLTSNQSLIQLDLSFNAIQDISGQRIATAIGSNKKLQSINLAQNNIGFRSCFIFAKVLKDHPSMKSLDLSTNPLTESGAKSIFRAILRGLHCIVTMRDCNYFIDTNAFNHSNPSEDSPYILDMSEPYNMAILNELIVMTEEDPINCRFANITWKESIRSNVETVRIYPSVDKVIMDKSTGNKWVPPSNGILKIEFEYSIVVPTMDLSIEHKALNLLAVIVTNGKTELDTKNWLRLMCSDIYCTTSQAEYLIDILTEKKVIGAGGLSKLDILKCVWDRILDPENLFDFLCNNLDQKARKDLIYTLSFEKFKFNWLNPSGHWRLDLNNETQRAVMTQIIAISNLESDYSKNSSKHGDTSQYGNWYNFRNVKYIQTNDFVITKEFLTNLPKKGILQFDYISTSRPNVKAMRSAGFSSPLTASRMNSPQNVVISNSDSYETSRMNSPQNVVISNSDNFEEKFDKEEEVVFLNSINEISSYLKPNSSSTSRSTSSTATSDDSPFNSIPNSSRNLLIQTTSSYPLPSTSNQQLYHIPSDKVISDEDFYKLISNLGLSMRNKVDSSTGIFILLELQHAVTKYYFPCNKVLLLLDYFVNSHNLHVKVLVILFNRIWDLYNFDSIMKNYYKSHTIQTEILKRIGGLNFINPLKPNYVHFNISLKYPDNRILVHSLIEISASDSGDQINEAENTQLSVVELYGSSQRLLNESRDEIMRFTFCEVGERSLNVSWTMRREQLKRYLLGDVNSQDREMFKIILMYKEMEASNTLSRGSIELQYLQFLKNKNKKGNSRGATRGKVISSAASS